MGKSNVIRDLSTDCDPAVLRARHDMDTYGIPMRDYQAWRSHYHSAKTRGIPFSFSLLGWRQWWALELARLEPGARRGRGRDNYVMARHADAGPYEPGNVFAMKPAGNYWDRNPLAREEAVRKATLARIASGKPRGFHLKIRGDGHPKSLAVITDMGRFGSIALASEAHGITRAGGASRVKRGVWTLDQVGHPRG